MKNTKQNILSIAHFQIHLPEPQIVMIVTVVD